MTNALKVKKRVVAILQADSTLQAEGVHVTHGFPPDLPEKRWLLVGPIRWDDVVWVTNRSKNEDYSITVVLSCVLFAGSAEEAESYAIDLMANIEAALKADPSFGGLCISSRFQPDKLNAWPTPDGFEVQYESEILCQSRV